MPGPAIGRRELLGLQGCFKRSLSEWIFPLVMLSVPFGLPIYIYFALPSSGAPLVIEVMVLGLLPALGLWGLYMLTTSYEFDGHTVTCRRLGKITSWRYELVDVKSVDVGNEVLAAAAGALNYFYIRWPERSRPVILTSDLRTALSHKQKDL